MRQSVVVYKLPMMALPLPLQPSPTYIVQTPVKRSNSADGMMFGAPGKCPMCSGFLRFSGGMYRCHGYGASVLTLLVNLNVLIKGKWKVPDETNNDGLHHKKQKNKPVRILLPPPSASPSQAANGQSQISNVDSLADLKVSIAGLPQESMEEWKEKIKEAGGVFHAKIKNDTNCFVVSGELDARGAEMRKARPAMMEFEIEMLLGKLSKSNIQKGFEALTDTQNLLNNSAYDPSDKESLVIDARFHEILKVKMLEALEDIEIASRLVGFDVNSDDEKYKKLNCDILPLPHDGEDFRLIEKYLLITFGKGIYFADLVSKSAQYCFTDNKNSIGLMLFIYRKLPRGKHSTKGLGKKVPKQSDFVKWKDDIIVPCGKPAPSNVQASELMYNEYIVYNTAQEED
ncbi:hypothetical protein PTKIN_Ptkin10aG0198600 [Pterospermum kingtungense]